MNKTLTTVFGCLIIFVATTLGATIVFFIKNQFSKKFSAIVGGFSAGVMVAASIFGLILPSQEYSADLGKWAFLPAVFGTAIGCFFLLVIDLITRAIGKSRGVEKEKQRLTRFVIAFTVHNIPEGMAVGFAFGSALAINTQAAMVTALMLALGIAVQNIPEGIAVALPVYKFTGKKSKGFLWGMLSGVVEPIFALVGVVLASQIRPLLPWFLCFSAGAMIFVSIDDLVPDSKLDDTHVGAWAFMIGFLVMMLLDII